MFGIDICLCEGIGCSLKDTCLRYKYHLKSNKEDYNTYFTTSPIKNKVCEYYIELKIDNISFP
jgi:hypothetical protein